MSTALFLSKVILSFHLNKDIVLSTLCLALKHSKNISLLCLNVVRAIITLRQLLLYEKWTPALSFHQDLGKGLLLQDPPVLGG